VKAVTMMLALPNLKHMTFQGHLDSFVEEVIKNNKKKDVLIDRYIPRPLPPIPVPL
jgi:hypothetical protein